MASAAFLASRTEGQADGESEKTKELVKLEQTTSSQSDRHLDPRSSSANREFSLSPRLSRRQQIVVKQPLSKEPKDRTSLKIPYRYVYNNVFHRLVAFLCRLCIRGSHHSGASNKPRLVAPLLAFYDSIEKLNVLQGPVKAALSLLSRIPVVRRSARSLLDEKVDRLPPSLGTIFAWGSYKSEGLRIRAIKIRDVRCLDMTWEQRNLGDDTGHAITLLHFHGGGYAWLHGDSHTEFLARLGPKIAAATGKRVRVLSVDYRTTREAPFPASLQDSWSVLDYVLEESGARQHIVLSGDSAGGGMVLMLLKLLAERTEVKSDPVAAAILFSPWVRMYPKKNLLKKDSSSPKASTGDWLTERWLEQTASYMHSDDLHGEACCPDDVLHVVPKAAETTAVPTQNLFPSLLSAASRRAEFRPECSLLCIMGEKEVLRRDGMEFFNKHLWNSKSHEYYEVPGGDHVSEVYDMASAETDDALTKAGEFVKQRILGLSS